jgi:hypothetical protein
VLLYNARKTARMTSDLGRGFTRSRSPHIRHTSVELDHKVAGLDILQVVVTAFTHGFTYGILNSD